MLIRICCPVCGKRLFDADVSASGMISAYCKRCKAERLIELKGKTSEEEVHDLLRQPLLAVRG